jgi:lipoyl-dependent peroxiredoxin
MSVSEKMANVTLEGDMRVTGASVLGNGRSYGELPSSLMERLDTGNEKTSPEDLIASAHAADFAMALASALSAQGNQPERLDVTATCVLDRTTEGLAISRMALDVKGLVPRIGQPEFEELARKAEEKCVLCGAMRGNVTFELTAELTGT